MTTETSRGHWGVRAALACLCLIFFLGVGWDSLRQDAFSGRKNDYYSQLVHGFLSGHLYLDRQVDPRMDSTDPKVRAAAEWPLDASYYGHHYYLYFGVTPAALFLLPYDWLTGGDLEPGLLVPMFVMAGYLLAFAVWRMVRRDSGLAPRPLFDICAAFVLGLATAAPQLLTRRMFYEIPIACGYACGASVALFLYRALSGRGRSTVQLGFASLFAGLSVGCRPELILILPAVAATAVVVTRRSRSLGRGGAWCAAALPAAVVGAGLAAYNYGRFGNPLDFGFTHQLDKIFSTNGPLARPGFVWPNLRWYYFTPPSLSPYFPFVYPEGASFLPAGYYMDEVIHGQFVVFLLAAFVVISAIALRNRIHLGRAAPFLWIVCWMFAAPLLALCFVGVRADRYFVDFQPMLVLATILVATFAAAAAADAGHARAWTAAFAGLALLSSTYGFFAGIQQFDTMRNTRPATYAALERLGNLPSYFLIRLGALSCGPVHLKISFPVVASEARIEPLVNTGSPDRTDALYVIESPGDMIQLVSDHHGYGGERSKPMHFVPGRVYDLKVDMGSLYPPLSHRFFADYGVMQARLIKSRIKVWLDDQLVMDARMDSYDSPPWNLEAGRNDLTMNPYGTRFSGSAVLLGRLPVEAARSPSQTALTGIWRIRCRLPSGRTASYPILSLGAKTAGLLVSAAVQAGGSVAFGVDEWGYPPVKSDAVPLDLGSDHAIEIFAGPLASQYNWANTWRIEPRELGTAASKLFIWMDGKLVCETELHRSLDPYDRFADIGANLEGFSTAELVFPGPIALLGVSEEQGREFLLRNLPPRVREDGGLWRIRFAAPAGDGPASYPLLVAGVPGDGTLFYGAFDGKGGLVLGFDQWGYGGSASRRLSAPRGTEHVAEILIGPLAARSAAERGVTGVDDSRLMVWFDGRLAVDGRMKSPHFGAADGYVEVGSNHQGFSTALPTFPGFILPEPFTSQEAADFLRRGAEASR